MISAWYILQSMLFWAEIIPFPQTCNTSKKRFGDNSIGLTIEKATLNHIWFQLHSFKSRPTYVFQLI